MDAGTAAGLHRIFIDLRQWDPARRNLCMFPAQRACHWKIELLDCHGQLRKPPGVQLLFRRSLLFWQNPVGELLRN